MERPRVHGLLARPFERLRSTSRSAHQACVARMSTLPCSPSTHIVALPQFTSAGMPSSRATMAAGGNAAPAPVTIAPAPGNRRVQMLEPGSVVSVQAPRLAISRQPLAMPRLTHSVDGRWDLVVSAHAQHRLELARR
jgi:hypothetical protein